MNEKMPTYSQGTPEQINEAEKKMSKKEEEMSKMREDEINSLDPKLVEELKNGKMDSFSNFNFFHKHPESQANNKREAEDMMQCLDSEGEAFKMLSSAEQEELLDLSYNNHLYYIAYSVGTQRNDNIIQRVKELRAKGLELLDKNKPSFARDTILSTSEDRKNKTIVIGHGILIRPIGKITKEDLDSGYYAMDEAYASNSELRQNAELSSSCSIEDAIKEAQKIIQRYNANDMGIVITGPYKTKSDAEVVVADLIDRYN